MIYKPTKEHLVTNHLFHLKKIYKFTNDMYFNKIFFLEKNISKKDEFFQFIKKCECSSKIWMRI
jgi:hypothetical protein